MKLFFTWLIIQCVFARMLFALMLNMWSSFKLPADEVVYFIVPPMAVCLVETVASAVLLYSMWNDQHKYGQRH